MRTTLSLDDDVAAMLEAALEKARREKGSASFKQTVNTALRQGLRQMKEPALRTKPFTTSVHKAGKCFFPNFDNTSEVLEELEGPWYK